MRLLPRLLGLALVVAAAGCAGDTAPPAGGQLEPNAPANSSESPTAPASARPLPAPTELRAEPDAAASPGALATALLLPVKGRAPKTGYDRDLFGNGWIDVDRNGCDTRNDMLARDLVVQSFKAGTGNCVVLTGALLDPYSAASIAFTRGSETSTAVQIDHVVALSDAWQKGAQSWDEGRRVEFANDPMNLLAVDGPLNLQKSDGDTATWLPPNKAYRCQYVARQVGVKYAYGLWVTEAERAAMVGVLTACPAEPLPTSTAAAAVDVGGPEVAAPAVVAPQVAAPPVAAPVPAAAPGAPYANCAAARAAGAAPVLAGDPGYSTALDRDRDGVGCE